jgi:hypothetical protein
MIPESVQRIPGGRVRSSERANAAIQNAPGVMTERIGH